MILVTGASGFVGMHLVRRMLLEKMKVRCFVRDKKKIKYEGAEIAEGNLLDKDSLYNATKNVDIVVHLAAVIKASNRKDLIDVNVMGVRNLIEACKKNKVRKIIHISSLDAGLKVANLYGQSKLFGEGVIKNSGIDYIILRPSLIYGKDSKDIIMLANLIKKSFFMPVVGTGQGRLQPLYVDDLCDIIAKILESNKKNKLYYVAGDEKISMNALIDKIARLYSKKVIKIHIPLWLLWLPVKLYCLIFRNSQINYESLKLLAKDKVCNTSEIKKDFNFKPFNLDHGLKMSLIH